MSNIRTTPKAAPIASTGSNFLDESDERHDVRIEDIGVVKVPSPRPMHEIVYEGVRYTHVSEDVNGLWVYRRL